ncbi:MAG: hypothetical protein C0506_10680 [Anaerolinea sp.]|nr:hypothetical protein [Anaerolinea sp.]
MPGRPNEPSPTGWNTSPACSSFTRSWSTSTRASGRTASSSVDKWESGRLLLRHYTPADAESYFTMWRENAEHLREFIPDAVARLGSVAEMVKHIAWMDAGRAAGRLFIFGGWSKDGGYVGEVYMGTRSPDFSEFELGYFLVRDAVGQGFATEAAECLVQVAFQELKVARLWARIAADNAASIAVAMRCGFQLVARHAGGKVKKDGSVVDLLVYSLTPPTASGQRPYR